MKKTVVRFLSLFLSLVVVFSAAVPAFAASESRIKRNEEIAEKLNAKFNNAAGNILDFVGNIVPDSVNVKKLADYTEDVSFKGDSEFLTEPADGAYWSLGYSEASILPSDFPKGKYFKGGYALDKAFNSILDDLKVRVIALDDNSGRDKVVFAVVDCIGLANADVKLIRRKLSGFAEENNIISVNVSATHVHSGIDTQGPYTNIVKSLFKNINASLFKSDKLEEAIDSRFLNIIVEKTAACAEEAVNNMKPGKLTFAFTNIKDYIRDRTDPVSYDENLYRFMFTPYDGSEKTIIGSFGAHPEAVGFSSDIASSDFVYYTEQVLNERGYNYIFIQGDLGTNTESFSQSGDELNLSRTENCKRYGKEIGYILAGMTSSDEERKNIADADFVKEGEAGGKYTPWYISTAAAEEEEVKPILNIKQKEVLLKISNGLYKGMTKLSLADNAVYRDGKTKDYYSPTEIGYLELGDDIKIYLTPGETYGELINGGEGIEGFGYVSIKEKLYSGKNHVLVMDLMNDAVGYVMPDNHFSYFTFKYSEDGGFKFKDGWGFTSVGKEAASTLIGDFYKLVDETK